MNSRAMEALLFRAHEERMSAMRGCDLPKQRPDFNDANEARGLLKAGRRAAVMALYAEGLDAKTISRRLGLSVKQVQHAVKP